KDAKGHPDPKLRHDCVVDMEFVGATGQGKPMGIGLAPGVANYYTKKKPVVGARAFRAAEIQDLYPGIDLVAYFDPNEHRPRYDPIVHPGANPDQIKIRYNGAKGVRVDNQGQVRYHTSLGDVCERRQMAYQKNEKGADYRFFPRQRMNDDGTV